MHQSFLPMRSTRRPSFLSSSSVHGADIALRVSLWRTDPHARGASPLSSHSIAVMSSKLFRGFKILCYCMLVFTSYGYTCCKNLNIICKLSCKWVSEIWEFWYFLTCSSDITSLSYTTAAYHWTKRRLIATASLPRAERICMSWYCNWFHFWVYFFFGPQTKAVNSYKWPERIMQSLSCTWITTIFLSLWSKDMYSYCVHFRFLKTCPFGFGNSNQLETSKVGSGTYIICPKQW